MDICSICLNETENKLECNHSHCFACLQKLIKKTDICPICRKQFNILPYRYQPPKHTPNLRLTTKLVKFFNNFLACRYLLKQGQHIKFYSSLMVSYHRYIYVLGKYISPETIFMMDRYDALQSYLYFSQPSCPFTNQVRNIFKWNIEAYLCSPVDYSFYNLPPNSPF